MKTCDRLCDALKTRSLGRSTGLALIAIGEALNNPGRCIRVADHYQTRKSDEMLMEICVRLINQLELVGVTADLAHLFLKYDPSHLSDRLHRSYHGL